MTCFIYISDLIIFVVVVLIFGLVGINHVTIIFNTNMIIVMMIFVVVSIFTFVSYYMGEDISNENFNLLNILFLSLIVLILVSYGVVMFIGWESISVISICLIGYWIRPIANSSAISAIIYNRWGDLVFLSILFGVSEVFVLMVVFAILCNSSLYIWQYWLPVAMESPTPVSSLLHSSTIVVAGVYLMILIPSNVPIVIVVILLATNIVGQIDVKNNIAYSTSIHLVLIVLLSMISTYSVVVVYIMLHSIVKGQLFQSSGYEIHSVGSQDIRNFNMNSSSIVILLAILILSALVSIVIVGSKEIVVLSIMNMIIVIVVVTSMLYTLMYGSKLSVVGNISEGEGYYVLLLMIMSIMVVDVSFDVWMSLLIFSVLVGIFYGNSMVTVL